MFEITGDDERLIDGIGYLGTGGFSRHPKNMDLGINTQIDECFRFFGDLDLPVHRRVIQYTPKLLSDAKAKLQEMIDILEAK